MRGVTLTYEAAVTGVGNYLSAQVEGKINSYQMKMLENNEIPGLLSARKHMINGVYRVNYEIDGMRRLTMVLASGQLHKEAAKDFMGDLLRTMSGLGEYFLSYMQCLLEMDYIYVDRSGRARLVYLPLSDQTITDEERVRNFCQKLFAEYFTADDDPFFLKLLRYVNMQDFSFKGLLEQFAKEDEGTESVNRRPQEMVKPHSELFSGEIPKQGDAKDWKISSRDAKDWKIPPRDEKDWKISPQSGTEKERETEPPKKAMDTTEHHFAIPGNQSFAMPQGKETKKEKEKKEKSGSLFKALLGSKKDREEKPKEKSKVDKKRGNNEESEVVEEKNTSPLSGEWRGTVMKPGQLSGEWHGTVMLSKNTQKQSHTMMLGANNAPYLLYQEKQIPLNHFPFSIGQENTDFVIPKRVVSHTHATISSQNGGYYVMDENSSNHTYLNGQRLAPYTKVELQDGDTLRLADESMTFHI